MLPQRDDLTTNLQGPVEHRENGKRDLETPGSHARTAFLAPARHCAHTATCSQPPTVHSVKGEEMRKTSYALAFLAVLGTLTLVSRLVQRYQLAVLRALVLMHAVHH